MRLAVLRGSRGSQVFWIEARRPLLGVEATDALPVRNGAQTCPSIKRTRACQHVSSPGPPLARQCKHWASRGQPHTHLLPNSHCPERPPREGATTPTARVRERARLVRALGPGVVLQLRCRQPSPHSSPQLPAPQCIAPTPCEASAAPPLLPPGDACPCSGSPACLRTQRASSPSRRARRAIRTPHRRPPHPRAAGSPRPLPRAHAMGATAAGPPTAPQAMARATAPALRGLLRRRLLPRRRTPLHTAPQAHRALQRRPTPPLPSLRSLQTFCRRRSASCCSRGPAASAGRCRRRRRSPASWPRR